MLGFTLRCDTGSHDLVFRQHCSPSRIQNHWRSRSQSYSHLLWLQESVIRIGVYIRNTRTEACVPVRVMSPSRRKAHLVPCLRSTQVFML